MTIGGLRQLRSAKEYSPYSRAFQATDFDLAAALGQSLLEAEQDGDYSDREDPCRHRGDLHPALDESRVDAKHAPDAPSSQPPPTSAVHTPISNPSLQAQRNRRRQYERRKRLQVLQAYEPQTSYAASMYSNPDIVVQSQAAFSLASSSMTSAGYTGLPGGRACAKREVVSLRKAQEAGSKVLLWDSRSSFGVYDRGGYMCLYGPSQPKGDASWNACIRDAGLALDRAGSLSTYHTKQLAHRRGKYPSLTCGISVGNGQTDVGNLVPETVEQGAEIQRLLRHPSFVRIAGHNSRSICSAAPFLASHIRDVVDDVMRVDSTLTKPFANSIFPACTFNCGSSVATYVHKDSMNLPYGWCAITALGSYDYHKGGHLYLQDLDLIIEFPPGSTLFILSAVIAHGNTPVAIGETRQSFTQYCAGALVRWRDYGYMTERRATKLDGGVLKAKLHEQRFDRLRAALALIPRMAAL